MLERFSLAFIPLFVAFDALGLLPLYWSVAEGLSNEQRRQTIHKAALVAWLVGLAFLIVSEWVLRALGIQMGDVMIAGGIILLLLALQDLLSVQKPAHAPTEGDFGVVPLAVPLIVGPAGLTALLLVRQRFGVWVAASAFNLNILLTWGALLLADRLVAWTGREGTRVISKISNLVLAAFAVMLVRQGMLLWLPEFK